MSFFNTTETAFGLDISNRSLRLIQLETRGKKTKVQLYNEISLPADCIASGEIRQPKVFLDSLNKLIKTRNGHGKLSDEVISVLPENKTFFKTITIPLVEDKDIENKIKEILPQDIPVDFNDIYMDWQVLTKNETTQSVLVGVSPKKIIDSYVDILISANLIPTVLEIESAAISRVLVEPFNSTKPQIVIDIGAQRTGLFLYDQQTVKFTISLPISGNNITKLIVDTLDLEWADAEKAKRVCGLDQTKCHGALLEIFNNTITELQTKISQAIDFYYNNFPNPTPIEKIILCGGGSNFLGIAQILQTQTKIPTIVSDPWQKIINPNPKYFNTEKSQSFITALGLGLRGLKPETFL